MPVLWTIRGMSQQGDRRSGNSGQQDDWWGQLYDARTADTGPGRAPDTLDDRFASAVDAVAATSPAAVPTAKSVADPAPYVPSRAPWEPPGELSGQGAAPSTFGPERPPRHPVSTDPTDGPEDLDDPAAELPHATAVPAAPPSRPAVSHVGDGPPTYDPEPTTLPPADPDELAGLVPDTVLDGARYGSCTLRAASVRGDFARHRGEPRRDALLTARFGSGDDGLLLVALATGARTSAGAQLAAAEACRWIGGSVGRSHARLAGDMRAARRADLKSGLHRLTDRSLGKLRAAAAERGVRPERYSVTALRCLLVPADPECRTRVFFGIGGGGLFRLRDGGWQDIEPEVTDAAGEPVVGFGSLPDETPAGERLTIDLGIVTPPSPYERAVPTPREPFRFRASVARPGDRLLLCGSGLAEPLRGEPELAGHLLQRWSAAEPPGLTEFLADMQVRARGYADDRTACAIWES